MLSITKHIILATLSALTITFAAAQSLPYNIPTRGLMAFYGFNGNANDLSGNGNHGTLQAIDGASLPVLTTDRFGNPNCAYLFGGVDNRNWIKVDNSESLKLKNKVSISFWMMQTSPRGGVYITSEQIFSSNAYFTVLAKGGSNDIDNITPAISRGFRIRTSWTGLNEQSIDFNNVNYGTNSNTGTSSKMSCYTAGQWIHVVVIIDSLYRAVYFNGTLYESGNYTSTSHEANFSQANNMDLFIGRMDGGDNVYFPFSGVLDDIAIYNRALSDAEIDSLYNNYRDPLATGAIEIDSVRVQNPCGSNYGEITIYPHPRDSVVFKYALGRKINTQDDNTLLARPGRRRCYVVSDCAMWDTVITLTCDCDPPLQVHHDSICPGDTGSAGGVSELVVFTFDDWEGWEHDGYWRLSRRDDNYTTTTEGISMVSSLSGLSAFCPTYWSTFRNSYNVMTSPAIDIFNDDMARVKLWFNYTAFTIMKDNYTEWATLALSYSSSPDGPWHRLWTNWDGGSPVEGNRNWSYVELSLSSLPGQGTYYFRFETIGAGYITGVDNFKIISDSRWEIPDTVTNALAGQDIDYKFILENTGMCPLEDLTHWHINKPTTSDTSVFSYTPYTWNDTTLWDNGDYSFDAHGTLKNSHGCDSTANLHLTIDFNIKVDTFATVCDSFVWHGKSYRASTLDSVFCSACNQYGADSTLRLHLTVNYSSTTDVDDYMCQGSSYDFVGLKLYGAGDYDTLLQSAAGCDSLMSLHLEEVIYPNVELGYDFDCRVGIYTVWATVDTGSFYWSSTPPDFFLEGHQYDDTIRLSPRQDRTYAITASVGYPKDCPTTKQILLPRIVDVNPQIRITPELLSVDNSTLQVYDLGTIDDRLWLINGVAYDSMLAAISYSSSIEDDSVVVSLIVRHDGCSDTVSRTVPIARSALWLPNIFTPLKPEGDINKFFQARGDGILELDLRVFNRQGTQVFATTALDDPWDGTYNGKPCPQGVYTYIARYKDRITPGNWQVQTGTVVLLH